jgi:hypothetical protein
VKKLFSYIAAISALILAAFSIPAHAQFNASGSFSTINTQCGTYFLQSGTYYNWQGVSVGSSLPFCAGSMSSQNAGAAQIIPAKFTNATLPTCNSSSVGLIATETDGAASPVYNATATGGGAVVVEVMCTYNGTTYNWTNH